MPEHIEPTHSPNQGKNVINDNTDEFDTRLDGLETKVRVGGIGGVGPNLDGGNITIQEGHGINVVPDGALDTLTLSVIDHVSVIFTVTSLRALSHNGMTRGTTYLALGNSAPGDGGYGFYWWDNLVVAKAFTATAADDLFTVTGHGFVDQQKVRVYGGTLPGNIFAATVYYITEGSTANTFRLSASLSDSNAGIYVNLTGDGSGFINHGDDNDVMIVPADNPQNGRWLALVAA